MTIPCVACRRAIAVPDERAANPKLKVRCTCGALFPLAEALPPGATAAKPGDSAQGTPPGASAAGCAPVQSAAPLRDAAEPAAGSAPSSRTATGVPRQRVKGWRWCAKHPQVRSESVCPKCWTGHCAACTEKVQSAAICPDCGGLCSAASKYEEEEARERQRARPMTQELATILAYPLGDPIAYVMLALFTWFFGMLGRLTAAYGLAISLLLSQGVLMWYCFYALSRVASGQMSGYMPDFTDLTDLIRPLRLSAAALLISWGPLLLLAILVPSLALSGFFPGSDGAAPAGTSPTAEEAATTGGVAETASAAPSDQEAGTLGPSGWAERLGLAQAAAWIVAVFLFALLWKVVYTPVALTVAGLSRSVLSTLNPAIGLDTIRRMGNVYWQALGIYTALALVQWLLGGALGLVPFLGSLLKSFVDAYAYLAIACTLGLAVHKKGRELAWDQSPWAQRRESPRVWPGG